MDDNSSRPVFLDFFTKLFTEIQHARPGDVQAVAPYLTRGVLQQLKQASDQLEAIEEIVVGSLQITRIAPSGSQVQIALDVEYNVVEIGKAETKKLYRLDRYVLSRKQGVLSRPPERARVLDCPNCGNPAEIPADGICPYCGQRVGVDPRGQFDWVLSQIQQDEPYLTSCLQS